jgi:ABC-2 type transport system ATP-binding protein
MSAESPILDLSGVSRRFGDRLALRDVSFRIDRNETVALLGTNGAGKTTTLRLIAGALFADAGTIRVCGEAVGASVRRSIARVGYLAEGAPAHGDMRVEDYLSMRARLKGFDARDAHLEVSRVIERCGVALERRTLIAHLSRGYRQRVGLAEAIVARPALLLLDEPTSGVDPAQALELRALIAELRQTCAIVVATHVLSDVERSCSRVIALRSGALVADEPVQTLRSRANPRRFVLDVRGDLRSALTALHAVIAARGPGGAVTHTTSGDDTARIMVEAPPGEDLRGACARAVVEAGLELFALTTEAPAIEDALAAIFESPKDSERGAT